MNSDEEAAKISVDLVQSDDFKMAFDKLMTLYYLIPLEKQAEAKELMKDLSFYARVRHTDD